MQLSFLIVQSEFVPSVLIIHAVENWIPNARAHADRISPFLIALLVSYYKRFRWIKIPY